MKETSARGRKHASRKKHLALLLPARDEELIIGHTIRSARNAGQPLHDIYIVDDGSTDDTRLKALVHLPAENILSIENRGKARAILAAIEHFGLDERYEWLHVADSDSVFATTYFKLFRRSLKDKRFNAAIGFVQSQRGNWINKYRAFSYTYGQHILRRIQAWFGMIAVFPGPVTCFRTSVIKHLDFETGSMTEDFDLTLQFHRRKLGRILYIPEAINYTQDPATIRDFAKQTARWNRGFFQGVLAHKIGRRAQRIDLCISYQLIEMTVYFTQLWVIAPVLAVVTGKWQVLAIIHLTDFIVMSMFIVFAAIVAKRPSILLALPTFYVLRLVELGIFMRSFGEVVLMRKFKTHAGGGWETKGRRYALSTAALKQDM